MTVPGGLETPLSAPSPDVAADEASIDYEVNLESLNQWQIAWRKFRKHKLALIGLAILTFFIAVAVVGPFIWPYDFYNIPMPDKFVFNGRSPSLAHPFGETGRLQWDVLTLVVNGARMSLTIGFASMFIGVFVGTIVGALSGFLGGVVDWVFMRIVDVMLSLPLLFVILVATRFFGNGSPVLVIVIFGMFSWMGVARLVRSLFLSLREQEFVEAARAVGVGDRRIIFRHILPNAVSPIVIAASLIIGANIITEAFVSFLGFGVSQTTPTWGNTLSASQDFLLSGNWWWPMFPGLAIILTVLAVNFIGDGLRDALDPRSRA